MATVLLEKRGTTAILTLNRPEVRNAVDASVMAGLQSAVDGIAADRSIRCVVFTGAGGEAFCSGGDLKALQALVTWDDAYAMSRTMQGVLHALEKLPIPVVAVLNGYAMGGGCEAMLASDVRVMEDHGFLSFKQLQMGLSLGWGGAARLARDLGGRQAFRLVLNGEKLAPQEAVQAGIIDEVVARGSGLERALHLAERYAQLPPIAVGVLKRMTRQDEPPRIHQEASIFATTWVTRDHHEAVSAFFEKRPPQWEGR